MLPVEEFRTDRWKAIDADVKFTGRRIVKTTDLPITDLYTHVVMTNGVLSLEPLKFGVAGGSLASDIHLDGSAVPLKGRFATSARHLKLKQLFPNFKTMQNALGEINGDAALTATGNSPAALAATSNGEVKALITDGTVSRLLMEAAGLNVANVVYEKLFGNRDVKINCAAADFVATDGVLESRVFALDTDDAVINIDGHINLRDETMDLGVHPHTKGFRVFSLRSPLYVKGTFKDPHVGVNAARAGVARRRGGRARPDQSVRGVDSVARAEQQQAAAVRAVAGAGSSGADGAAAGRQAAAQGGAFARWRAGQQVGQRRRPRRLPRPIRKKPAVMSPASAAEYKGS